MVSPFFEGFLDGFTGGGLFTKLRRPGAATQVFADESEEQSQPPTSSLQLQSGDRSQGS
jgi:hypothetical protein